MERNEFVMLVARNIEAEIARKGTNAAEVARRAGINPTGVYDILNGKSASPRLDTIHKIAVLGLGVSVATLMRDPDAEEVDRELLNVLSDLPEADRRKFLAMARAILQENLHS